MLLLYDRYGFPKAKHLHCHSLISNGEDELLAWIELGRTMTCCAASKRAYAEERYLLSLIGSDRSIVVVSAALGMGTNYLYHARGEWRMILEIAGVVQDLSLATYVQNNWDVIVKGGKGLPLD
jgi:hypothetical protein